MTFKISQLKSSNYKAEAIYRGYVHTDCAEGDGSIISNVKNNNRTESFLQKFLGRRISSTTR